MKTDRELLMLAAKSAGFPVHIWGNEDRLNCARIDIDLDTKWNPLTDDGDALRLACVLDITIDIDLGEHRTLVNYTVNYDDLCLFEGHGLGSSEATRRAITRAAAAIGEQMP